MLRYRVRVHGPVDWVGFIFVRRRALLVINERPRR